MKELILKFIKKYPITFLSILSFAVFAIMIFQLSDAYPITYNTNLLNDLLMFSLNMIFGSFLCYKLLDIYGKKLHSKIQQSVVISNIIVALFPIVLYFISRLILSVYLDNAIFATSNLASIFFLITLYFIIKKNEYKVSDYIVKVFINALYVFLLYCIVASGIAVLLFIYTILFVDINFRYVMYIYIFITVIIGYTGLFISIEKISQKLSIFAKVLVKYIMMIMVLIGFIFFYVYLIKIIISREIPSNQVFTVCTVLFSVGLLIALMSRAFDENKLYDKTIKYLPLVYIPALVLQIVSIYIRINKYGLTLARYTGIFIIIFEILYIIIYMYKYEKIKYLFISQAILIFIMNFMPYINQYQFPNIYNNYVHKSNVLMDSNDNADVDVINKIIYGYRHESIYEMDVSGFSKLYKADIHIKYNDKEKTWQNFNHTSKQITDFTSVDVIDYDSNVITTIDISDFIGKIEQNILKYDYTDDDDKIFENIDNIIENDNKQYHIGSVSVYYSVDINNFTEIIMYGNLLIK